MTAGASRGIPSDNGPARDIMALPAGDPSSVARPVSGGLLDRPGPAVSSTRDSILIVLPPAGTTNFFTPSDRRHGALDRALGSLVDEEFEFLRS